MRVDDLKKYCNHVIADNKNYCKNYQLACKRFLKDVESDNQYYFDESESEKLFLFIQNLKQFEDVFFDKPLILEDWEKFILAQIYCWKKKSDNKRRIKRIYIQVARKNGKTILMSVIALYSLIVGKSEEIYSLASKKDQAKIVYDKMCGIIRQTGLEKYYKIFRGEIRNKSNKYVYVSADHKLQDGTNPSIVIADEYHAHPTDELLNVYTSGMGARSEPLVLIITTAGFNLDGPCYEEYERAEKILNGIYEDESYLPIIFELDESDSWEDECVYKKANPNLNVSVGLEYLQGQKLEAQQRPSKRRDFLTKNLNIWVDGAESWIDLQTWRKNKEFFDVNELEGRDCFAGLDLSAVSDLTAYSLYFPPDDKDEKVKVLHKCYIPESSIDKKEKFESIKFREWIDQGYVTPTPGEVVDYSYLVDDLLSDAKLYNIKEIAFDSYLSKNIIKPIEDELGEDVMIEMRQGLINFSPWTKEWEKDVLANRIIDFNPVMEWCISNTVIKTDQNGNYKPLKEKPNKKIDLVISSIMAHARMTAVDREEFRSIFEVLMSE